MSWWVTKTASNGGSCAGDSWVSWGPYGSKKNRSPNECEKDDFKSCSVHLICGRRNGSTQTDERAVDRKSTRLNSSHVEISYAVFCLKKKKKKKKLIKKTTIK